VVGVSSSRNHTEAVKRNAGMNYAERSNAHAADEISTARER
jgi:hypothetical protein